MKEHTTPWECTYAKEERSRCKPGKRPKSDQEYFEILCLCVLQAGLGWGLVRKNWRKYRNGLCDFDIDKLAESPVEDFMEKPDVIRNSRKIKSVIYNAKEFQRIRTEYGSFSGFLESLRLKEDTNASMVLQQRLKHVGDYAAEYYLHSVGYW